MKTISWKRVWYVFGLSLLSFLAFDLATPNMCGEIGLLIIGPFALAGAFLAGLFAAAISRGHVFEQRTKLVALGTLVGLPLFIYFVAATNALPMTVGNCAL